MNESKKLRKGNADVAKTLRTLRTRFCVCCGTCGWIKTLEKMFKEDIDEGESKNYRKKKILMWMNRKN